MSQPPFVKSHFRGTDADCLQQAAVDAGRAGHNGYVPVSQTWADSTDTPGVRELTVIYEWRGAPASFWVVPEAAQAGPAPGWAYVGFWRRFGAFLIDAVILAVPMYAAMLYVLVATVRSMPRISSTSFTPSIDPVTGRLVYSPEVMAAVQSVLAISLTVFAIFFVVQILYYTLLWWRFGATLGQRVLGIQIRREADGARMGFWRSAMRYGGYLVSGWVFLLGFIWIAIDGRKQGWHDKIAGTVAIRRAT